MTEGIKRRRKIMEMLGPYQLLRRLGRGGMGAVYEGLNIETGDRAAVKVLPAPLSDEPGFRERFDAEIEVLKKLNHPGIARLYGFGQHRGQVFYAMELVEGASLEEELQRKRQFDWREVARIGLEISRALRHAHDRGVVHRDIKPGNLLLARDGSVKLADFGIARLFGAGRLTGGGSVLGTVEYMAPEQAEGRPVDARADLYSLGCVLYALLARRPPYRANTLPEILALRRQSRPEPIGRLVSGVPDEFQAIVSQLLETDPGARAPNASVLGRRLEAVLNPPGSLPVTMADPSPDESRSAAEPEAGKDGATATPTGGLGEPIAEARPSPASEPSGDSEGLPGSMQHLTYPPPSDAEQKLPETRDISSPGHEAQSAGVSPAPAASAGPPSARFTVISPEELDRAPEAESRRPMISLQTAALALALALVGLVIWYLLQPATADDLYERITQRTADGQLESLSDAEDLIREFLIRFPKDSRSVMLRRQEREIELYRLQRRFDRRAAGLIRSETLLPVERDYLEALYYSRFDPQRAIRKLQAILVLYGHGHDLTGPTGQCVELARRRLERLSEQVEQQSPHELESVDERLRQAEELATKDPAQARSIAEAVIELFSEKPWAAEAVQQARELLKRVGGRR